jgi:serine/threonine protein kinase
VKPANVMLAADGRTKVMDLGIARTIDGESLTRTTSILGSPNYLSPEQARGERVDARSDIYSLGCVLYEMLSGRPPFEAESPVAVAYKHVHEEPTPPSAIEPSVPAALDAVTLRAMAKDPADRFATADDLAAALEDRTIPIAPVPTVPLAVAGPTDRVPAPAPTARLPRRTDRVPRRNLVPILLALVVVVVLLGIAAAWLLGGPERASGDASPSRSPEPTRSASPTSSPSPSSPSQTQTPPPPDAVDAAAATLATIVDEGVADGTISEKAAEEIDKGVEEALEKFAEGDTGEAIKKLEELESKIADLVDEDEIAHSEQQQLDRAIQDLEEEMVLADPPGDEDD